MANGINFSPVATDTARGMDEVVGYILGLDISPAEKIKRINTAFELVGSDFYIQMFDANSQLFDSTAIGTDYTKMTNQIEDLARKIVQNYNLGRKTDTLVKDFYDSALGKAQDEAFKNAISLDKHPTLTRSIVGETCGWCVALAGVHTNPDSEMFRRHANCDCLFVTSGYNSRNGILTNYVKTPGTQLNNRYIKGEEIASTLQKTGDKIYNKLTPDEKKALADYTDAMSATFNMAQTGNRPLEFPEDIAQEQLLNNILRKSNMGENVIVYSGVSDPDSFDGFMAQKGEIFVDRKYVSASLNQTTANEFADYSESGNEVHLEIRIPAKAQALYLGNNSWAVEDQELIIQKASRYRVIDRKENNGIIEMILEILND